MMSLCVPHKDTRMGGAWSSVDAADVAAGGSGCLPQALLVHSAAALLGGEHDGSILGRLVADGESGSMRRRLLESLRGGIEYEGPGRRELDSGGGDGRGGLCLEARK